jgi:hypothetical protein
VFTAALVVVTLASAACAAAPDLAGAGRPVVAPVLGGALSSYASWRWIFC